MRIGTAFCLAAAAVLVAERGDGVGFKTAGVGEGVECSGPAVAGVKLTKAKFLEGDPDHSYVFEGECLFVESNKAPGLFKVKVLASWDNTAKTALEKVTVTGDANGTLLASLSCPKDPWINDVVCTGGYSNTTGVGLLSHPVPFTKGMTNAAEAKSKSSAGPPSAPPPPPPAKTKPKPKIQIDLPTRTPTKPQIQAEFPTRTPTKLPFQIQLPTRTPTKFRRA